MLVQKTSGDGLTRSTVYTDSSNRIGNSETDTITYDSNGDGGTNEDFEQSVGWSYFTSANGKRLSSKSANGAAWQIALTLASSGRVSVNATTTATGNVAIDDNGVKTTSVNDTASAVLNRIDNQTRTVSVNRLRTKTTTSVDGSAPYIEVDTASNPDGSSTCASTFWDMTGAGVIQESTNIAVSFDGRQTKTNTLSDRDASGAYLNQTDLKIDTAAGGYAEARTAFGSFGAHNFSAMIAVGLDSSENSATTVRDFFSSNFANLVSQGVVLTSADGLRKGFVFDETGSDLAANVRAGAYAVLAGGTPTGLTAGDIYGSDVTVFNNGGTTTQTYATFWGVGRPPHDEVRKARRLNLSHDLVDLSANIFGAFSFSSRRQRGVQSNPF